MIISGNKVTVNGGGSSGSGKYIVPNGTKFGCSKFIDFDNLDFSQVTDASDMFKYYYGTELDLSTFNSSQLTSINGMFANSKGVTHYAIEDWNVSSVEDIGSLFQNCTQITDLDLSKWRPYNLTSFKDIIRGCTNLKTLNLSGWKFPKITELTYLNYSYFSTTSIKTLESIDVSGWETSQVTKVYNLFNFVYFNGLKTVNISGWNLSNAEDIDYLFGPLSNNDKCNFENIIMDGVTLPKRDMTINGLVIAATKGTLTVESLVSALNALPQLDDGESFTFTLGNALDRLSEEQKSIATNKSWKLA